MFARTLRRTRLGVARYCMVALVSHKWLGRVWGELARQGGVAPMLPRLRGLFPAGL